MMSERRKCQNGKCQNLATHAAMWTEGWVYHCEKDALWMCNVGDNMGFETARASLRLMTEDELFNKSQVEITADELVEFFSKKMGIHTTRTEAIEGTKRWVDMFKGRAELLDEYHSLWTELAKALCEEDSE